MTCKNRLYFLPALLCFVLSAGIYQAYVAVAASLLVIFLIQETLYSDLPIGKIFRKGLLFLCFLLISLGLYWGISQLFLSCNGTEFNTYSQSALSQDQTIPERIKVCIFFFIHVFTIRFRSVIVSGFSQLLHFICIGTAGLEILFWLLQKKHLKRIPMLLFLLAVYPFAVTSVLLIVDLNSVHTLVIYSFATVYVLSAVIVDGGRRLLSNRKAVNTLRGRLFDLTLLCMALVICTMISPISTPSPRPTTGSMAMSAASSTCR